jgi:hypothetical protein
VRLRPGELAVTDQPHARLGQRGHGSDPGPARTERRRGARLVVVLDEPDEALPLAKIGLQVGVDLIRFGV